MLSIRRFAERSKQSSDPGSRNGNQGSGSVTSQLRSSGLPNMILQGTVKGKRKRGIHKRRWKDNIKEWTGMDFASSVRAAEKKG